jgi:2-polyprenyl-3-methyl-5-hydroxy-6-metoxy-1,4-benzoquinol methylase
MKKDRTEKFWDKLANQFDKQAKHFEQPPVEKAKKYLKNSDTVLDFGCATGTVTCEISSCVKEATGIDISSKMIDIAKSKAGELKIGNVDFRQATLFDKDYKRESFDVILAFNIIHFFKDTQEILQRMHELLKPEGLIIIATACTGQWTFSNILQFILFSPMIKARIIPYMKFFKFAELKDSIGKEGFQVEVVENLKSATNYFIVAKKK